MYMSRQSLSESYVVHAFQRVRCGDLFSHVVYLVSLVVIVVFLSDCLCPMRKLQPRSGPPALLMTLTIPYKAAQTRVIH